MLPLTGEGFLPRWPTARDRARSRPAGTSIAFAIVVHALVFAAAGRIAWTRVEPEPRPQSAVVWLGVWPRPESAVAVAAPVAPLETPPPAVDREVPATPPAERRPATAPSAAGPEPVRVPSPPPAQRPVRRTDWDEERRRAISDVLARRARADAVSALSVEELLEARPPPEEPRPNRSIFDSPSRSGGRALFHPGLARTRLGRRIGELCNALGGIGFFGLATCGVTPDDEPSGLFPEVMPEYLKLMPECVETRPLAPLLAESSRFPTVKCRLVPKEGEEALSPQ